MPRLNNKLKKGLIQQSRLFPGQETVSLTLIFYTISDLCRPPAAATKTHNHATTQDAQLGHHTLTPPEMRTVDVKPKNCRKHSTEPLGDNRDTSSEARREAMLATLPNAARLTTPLGKKRRLPSSIFYISFLIG